MKKVALLSTLLLLFSLAGAACSKKEPPPVPPPGEMPGQGMPPAQGMPPGQPGAPPHGPMGGGAEKKIVVPDDVKNSWKAVKVDVDYKEKKTRKQFTVPLNSDFRIPDSDATMKVGAFLPHFMMTADTITSNSNNTENPAVNVEVLKGDKPVFKGWLFAKYPTAHPFQDDKLGLTLVEGIRK